MSLFRKKPVVIEAQQLPTANEITQGAADRLIAAARWCGGHITADGLVIETLEGTMTAAPGDWIICGVQGEFYPCKPDIFEKTYEPVPDGSS